EMEGPTGATRGQGPLFGNPRLGRPPRGGAGGAARRNQSGRPASAAGAGIRSPTGTSAEPAEGSSQLQMNQIPASWSASAGAARSGPCLPCQRHWDRTPRAGPRPRGRCRREGRSAGACAYVFSNYSCLRRAGGDCQRKQLLPTEQLREELQLWTCLFWWQGWGGRRLQDACQPTEKKCKRREHPNQTTSSGRGDAQVRPRLHSSARG
ncbi:unnamed protein product, partial [Prorocentrum cordatum]